MSDQSSNSSSANESPISALQELLGYDQALRERIAEHPLETLGLAAIVGFTLGREGLSGRSVSGFVSAARLLSQGLGTPTRTTIQ